MPYKVLVVDDSAFYRRRLISFLNEDPMIEVIGQAKDGKEAVEMAASLKPDVITMDVEMPVMNGIDAVRIIMARRPTAILMFSSLTHEGAQVTLDALEAGALDFISKNFDDVSTSRPSAVYDFRRKVKLLARHSFPSERPVRVPIGSKARLASAQTSTLGSAHRQTPQLQAPQLQSLRQSGAVGNTGQKPYKLLVIGASTGGPVALQQILNALPKGFPHPILLVQHMPGTFTTTFAQRLDASSALEVKLAQHGDILRPGVAYLAQGGKQMRVKTTGAQHALIIEETPQGLPLHYHPCIDYTLESIAPLFDDKVLCIILTGMGADGALGCKTLKQKGATIWAQDEQSCVVYGMPKAVVESGSCDRLVSLPDIATQILTTMQPKAPMSKFSGVNKVS